LSYFPAIGFVRTTLPWQLDVSTFAGFVQREPVETWVSENTGAAQRYTCI